MGTRDKTWSIVNQGVEEDTEEFLPLKTADLSKQILKYNLPFHLLKLEF